SSSSSSHSRSSGTGDPSTAGGDDGNRGYYTVMSDADEARVHFANVAGTSDFRAIAAMDDGSIVIGGQGTGPLTFPEVMLGDDGLDGFIMVIPPTPSDP
ncbi:MAG: hypothetical protein AB8H86_05630, partial [Polyangiales bacterium]